jgi:hypothetical protein
LLAAKFACTLIFLFFEHSMLRKMDCPLHFNLAYT